MYLKFFLTKRSFNMLFYFKLLAHILHVHAFTHGIVTLAPRARQSSLAASVASCELCEGQGYVSQGCTVPRKTAHCAPRKNAFYTPPCKGTARLSAELPWQSCLLWWGVGVGQVVKNTVQVAIKHASGACSALSVEFLQFCSHLKVLIFPNEKWLFSVTNRSSTC